MGNIGGKTKNNFTSELEKFVRVTVSEHLTPIQIIYNPEDELRAVVEANDNYDEKWNIPVIFHGNKLMIYCDLGQYLPATPENLNRYLFFEAATLIHKMWF